MMRVAYGLAGHSINYYKSRDVFPSMDGTWSDDQWFWHVAHAYPWAEQKYAHKQWNDKALEQAYWAGPWK